MSEREIVILQRDCSAYMVPSGARIMLHAGTEVSITQSLGDSYTVSVYGNLARIEAKDSEALGKQAPNPLGDLSPDATLDEKIDVLLAQVYDPEIPVNVVDLGLIYHRYVEVVSGSEHRVRIVMTLTAPGCGMGPVIADDIKRMLLSQAEIVEAEVEIVFDPPWDRSMMSAAAQLELGMM